MAVGVSGLEPMMASTPPFGGASAETIARLADRGSVRRYRRNTYLFHQGDESPEVFFLVDGRVEISSLSASGHRQLHTTLDRPQFFGELGVLGGMPRTPSSARWRGRCNRTRRSSKTCCSSISRDAWPSGCCSSWRRRSTTSRPTAQSFLRW